MRCYAIIGVDEDGTEIQCFKEQDEPFCSPEHEHQWQDNNYNRKDGENTKTIAYVQKRLRLRAQEAAEKQRQAQDKVGRINHTIARPLAERR